MGKIFGVSVATILTIVVVAVLVRKFGNSVPILNTL